jgi:multiple sugar transport system permease protein
VLIIAAVLVVAPIAWAFSTSLRTPAESFNNPPQWIPTNPDFSNYRAVFQQVPLWKFIGNSIFVTGLIVIGQIIPRQGGYAFAMVSSAAGALLFA